MSEAVCPDLRDSWITASKVKKREEPASDEDGTACMNEGDEYSLQMLLEISFSNPLTHCMCLFLRTNKENKRAHKQQRLSRGRACVTSRPAGCIVELCGVKGVQKERYLFKKGYPVSSLCVEQRADGGNPSSPRASYLYNGYSFILNPVTNWTYLQRRDHPF